ncbi:MAG: hypothetical protein IPM69_05355 [Ignavibacteria bacterium]|nr:hypothetical protein [Ignavibacteria bacterium]
MMIKQAVFLTIILVILCVGCTSIQKINEASEKKLYKVIAISDNYFRNKFLIFCSNNNTDYLILSKAICSDSNTLAKKINIDDTIDIAITPIAKPSKQDFIDSGFKTQRPTSLFLLFKDSTLNESIAIATKDSILGNYHYSPDICGKYLIHR